MDLQDPTTKLVQSNQGLPQHGPSPEDPPTVVKSSNSPQVARFNGLDEVQEPTALGAKSRLQKDHDGPKSSSSIHESSTSLNTHLPSTGSRTSVPAVPRIQVDGDSTSPSKNEKPRPSLRKSRDTTKTTLEPFQGLRLDLPSGTLSEELPTDNIEFSNRGSMLLDGQKLNGIGRSQRVSSREVKMGPSEKKADANRKPLSAEEESMSLRVRACYEAGADTSESIRASSLGRQLGLGWRSALDRSDNQSSTSISRTNSITDLHEESSPSISTKTRPGSVIVKEENELAGGFEDWQDIQSADVDRYGFITPRSPISDSHGLNTGLDTSDQKGQEQLGTESTNLSQASGIPHRKRIARTDITGKVLHRRSSSNPNSRDDPAGKLGFDPDRRPNTATLGRRESTLRHAANKMPYNRSRRLKEEASDMLSLPTLSRGPNEKLVPKTENRARIKENKREEKWRKMARLVSNQSGGGMIFEFDTNDPKLISRTWKGIPDRWRATAWYAFLSSNAKRVGNELADNELVHLYHEYLSQSSPDDVQIDIDVPRTINSHIMFRRRYRGGQRLLFRVLHGMSLHFPDTGYVQGMAALAVTLLAYYDEEQAFIMLVRLWDLRGLNKLYTSGFGGLMQALDDFEKAWLGNGEVAVKLVRYFSKRSSASRLTLNRTH